jgi:transcriptional regulator with XRE-family HTH domain
LAKKLLGLKSIRESKLMSQQELAAKSGLTVTTVSRIETDKVKPSVKTIRALALALDYTPHHFKNLLDGKPSKQSISDPTDRKSIFSRIGSMFKSILRRK